LSYAKLDELNRNIASLDHALAILGADEATNMPEGGGEQRAESMAALAGLRHEQASAPHIGDWIAAAENEDLTADQELGLAEFKRLYTHLVCLPSEFVKRQTSTAMRCEQLWRTLRPTGDWERFADALEDVVALTREEAAMRAAATGLAPYDALMEQFDPGNRTADIAPVFDRLKSELKTLLPEILEAQERRLADNPIRTLEGPFPVPQQRELGLAVMGPVGFDFDHGRLDTSHHPFCGGVPTDVRMTTRYREDGFLTALLAVLHETGHALYEQGLPRDNHHWPHNHSRGMGLHESQSLFVEMQISRSPEFWEWVRPIVDEKIGPCALKGWTPEDVLNRVNHVEPGFIRVDADEVTYPFHVILRFEIEQELVAGTMQVRDIPEAWNARMKDYLGLETLNNPADGPMQDVHWAAGLFGYFPSYTLGAMMAAQQWAAVERAIPDAAGLIARGVFGPINDWRRENIWSQGARWSTPELMTRATGEPLDPHYFIDHLRNRYL